MSERAAGRVCRMSERAAGRVRRTSERAVRRRPAGRNRARPCDESRSLDRIDPQFGYLPGNVELVSQRANRLKGDGTAEEHLRIARWLERLAV